ncbi:hypothetical protein JXB01_03775 [Candidatus Micrarchaeota archaeon]|nr:hypothetical protein [Candidatus Micrarchaeota archaeon]
MKNYAFPLFFILLLTFSGCLTSMPGFEEYVAQEKASEYSLKMESLKCPTDESCVCFVCRNETPLVWPFSYFLSASLEEGECYLKEPCTQDVLKDLGESDEEGVMPFLLGVGPRFFDFNEANQYCNNSLKMAVHWLDATNRPDLRYPLPDEEQARCYLGSMVIPVYILYSGGENIDSARAGAVGDRLKDVGPAIVTTEIDFENTPENIAAVKQQVLSIKSECGDKCLVAVAPKMGDYEALDELLSDEQVNKSVDLVAFGVNSRYATKCGASSAFLDALNFSKVAWFNHHKPVVFAYMLFDKDGPNKDLTCNWSEYEASRAYSVFFNSLLALKDNGIIGAAPYQMYYGGNADPLKCDDCALMTINESGQFEPNGLRFNSFFYGCQNYGPKFNYVELIFSSDRTGSCSYLTNIGYLTSTSTSTAGYGQGFVPNTGKSGNLFTCEVCIDECEEDEDCDYNPFNIPSLHFDEGYCTSFPELDFWASVRGLDPLFVRAKAYSESGLNYKDPLSSYCAVGVRTLGSGCNPLKLGLSSTQPLNDPSGICDEYWTENNYWGLPGNYNREINGVQGKPCDLGLMQNIESPYQYWDELGWDENSGDVYKSALECGNGEWNPFNGYQSACLGTYKLNVRFNDALGEINGEYSYAFSDYTSNEKKWTALFLTVYKDKGVSESTIDSFVSKFSEQKNKDDKYCQDFPNDVCCKSKQSVGGSCCNNDNFIEYVSCCVDGDPDEVNDFVGKPFCTNDYGVKDGGVPSAFKVVSFYEGFKDSCTNYGCPPTNLYKNIQETYNINPNK